MNNEDFVEIVEEWNGVLKLHEIMTYENWDKKHNGEPYETIHSDDQKPWVEMGEGFKNAAWVAKKTPMKELEFKYKFGTDK